MDNPTVSPRLPVSRQDNKLILNCQRCDFRCLVDVVLHGTTDWICPTCLTQNRVKSERYSRTEWIEELARKAGLRQ
jgi:late competence protein required for DNA uptake (superfamily II DNA/RNA helicase)